MRICIALALALLFGGCASKPTAPKNATAADFDLGRHHFKVTTNSREAQRAFDRGLIWTFSFAHYAAEQEFRRAAQLDPQLAMAWWGIALVNGPHINFNAVPPDRAKAAWEALTKARELAPNAGPLERELIEALSKRYANPQPDDRTPLDRAYADAMRELWRRNQTDDDIGALFAESMMDLRPWDLWQANGEPQPGTPEIIEALERVLWLNPKHPGANHYYIHAVEASRQPQKALPSARRLGKVVPGAGHMVHMPAHIYARVGDWDAAAQSNIDAIRADGLYRAVYPRPGFYAMYMAHNSHFFAWAAMMQGRSAEALHHAREMVAGIPEDFLQEFGPAVDGYLAFVPEVLMRFGRWEEILAEPKPRGDLPLSQALWRYARVASLAALGRLDEARAERAVFETAAQKVPANATFGNNSATNLLAIARLVLDGEIAAQEKNYEGAIPKLEEAARLEDTLRYDEPPDWIQPVRHTLGAVLLKANKPSEAEAVYREDLARNPENAWSLYGLAQSLEGAGKGKEASAAQKRFRKAWKKSDLQITASCLCLR